MRVIVLAALVTVALAQTSYEGYKVYEIYPRTRYQEKLLRQLADMEGYDFWGGLKKAGHKSTIMISPELLQHFTDLIKSEEIQHKMIISDVELAIRLEKFQQSLAPKLPKGKISFDAYHSHQEIIDYVLQIGADYPDIVTLENIGQSYEGRDLIVLKICSGICGENPGILIEGGIHAREWIGPAMVTYIVQELVENPENIDMVNSIDWYILPVTNPDGYEYTRSDNRMWRKTRKPGDSCVGTDANRNFDFFWMHDGASSDECSNIYGGPEAFSEPETRAFSQFVLANRRNIHLYLAMHSYGQWIIYPWGYAAILPDDWEELQALGEAVNQTIWSVAGTSYEVGNSAILLYPAAGCSDDWVKSIGIELSYTIELPGGGDQGFDLPPSRILPVVTETWEGIKTFQAYVLNKFGRK